MIEWYIVPKWFAGYDLILETGFGLITFFLAFYSYYIYRLSGLKECKTFAQSFFFVSLAYFVWPLIHVSNLRFIDSAVLSFAFGNYSALGLLLTYSYLLFFTIGISLLALLSMNLSDRRARALLITLPLLVIIFSANAGVAFSFVTSLLLFYICLSYFTQYNRKKSRSKLLVFSSFVLIFLGNVQFIFANLHNAPYVIGHLLMLGGYLTLSYTLIKIIRP